MKKQILLFFILLSAGGMMAQSQFNWQGVVRNSDDIPVTNQNVGVQLTIMQNGTMVMRETHDATTSDIGLVNLLVCTGTNVSGSCDDIDWSTGSFMLNVAIDVNGGSSYADYGSSPIAMVPRAAFAQDAMNVINDQVDDADSDPTNEIQELMFDNNTRTLSITGVAGTIRIPSTGQDADFDPENELQQLSKNAQGQIVLSHNNGFVVDGVVDDEVDDADSDPTNEIQDISLNNNMLSIEGGSTVDLSNLGGGGSVWSLDGENIFYDVASTPNARIEYGAGTFSVGLGGTQYRTITGRSNRLTDELSFDTPNSGKIHAIGHYIQDFPSPDYSEIYMTLAGDTMSSTKVRNFATSTTTDSRLYHNFQNNRVIGFRMVSANGFGRFEQYVDNAPGVLMGIVNGNQPFVGIPSPNNPNQIVSFLSRDAMGAAVKNFYMDHPNDPDKQIWYACIEGPEAAAYERGTAQLVDGEAFIPFSEHFEIVINPETMTVNITPNSAESLGLAVVEKTAKGIRVKELYKGTGNYEFDWEVKAVRKGYEDYRVIRDKSEMQISDEVQLD